jgi:prevent-host-death family protein
MIMKTVSARQANREFSALLSRAERGEEILITKHNKPVAVLSPYRSPDMTAERKKAIQHALRLMKKGLPWGDASPGSPATRCMIGNDQFRHERSCLCDGCTRR